MARILALSSWTATGHVGLSAAVPALQALGHHVTALPTIILSNHPGFPHAAGRPVPPADLAAMIDALDLNGWLAGHDALLTGYLPTVEHVSLAAGLAQRLRRLPKPPRIVVDPVLGDDPRGLYIPKQVAEAIRTSLAPLANILTPNRFELSWLTGRPVGSLPDAVAAARGIARRVLVTSPPLKGATGILDINDGAAVLHEVPIIPDVPHGAGDVLSGLVAAGLSPGASLGHLAALCAASAGTPHLAIIPSGAWRNAPLVPGRPLNNTAEV